MDEINRLGKEYGYQRSLLEWNFRMALESPTAKMYDEYMVKVKELDVVVSGLAHSIEANNG